jgi:hypothetical protein
MFLEEKHSENEGLPKKFTRLLVTIGNTMIICINSLKIKSIALVLRVVQKPVIKVDAIRKIMIALLIIKSPI